MQSEIPTQKDILEALRYLRPWTMRSLSKVRIGGESDGAYVVPTLIFECDWIVSIGIGHDVSFDLALDVSFDLALAERDARIHTLDKPLVLHPNFIFEKKGWGIRTEGEFLGIEDIIARLRIHAPKHAMLKFDIEGLEYALINAMPIEYLSYFDIIACEFHALHYLGNRQGYQLICGAFQKLFATHAPVHLHANNGLGFTEIQGVPIPILLELSYLRRGLDTFLSLSTDPIPGSLDRPNNPQRPDLCLNPF